MRFLLITLLPSLLFAQAPTSQEALSLSRIESVSLSPNGQRVAYTLSRTNWEDNAFESDLYLASVDGSEPIRLTGGKKSASSPVWSPDGKQLAFISTRDAKPQIYLFSLAGGEPMQLTDHETGISSFEWRDPDWIYFIASDPESDAMKERKKTYGELTIIDEDYQMSHAWRVKLAATPKQKGERLTSGAFHVLSLELSPDLKSLALVTKANPELSTTGAKLEILSLDARQRLTLHETKNSIGRVLWSPDSTRLIWTGIGEDKTGSYLTSHIWSKPLAGGNAADWTPNLNENPQLLAWSPAGILFTSMNKTNTDFNILRPGEVPNAIGPPGWNLANVSLTPGAAPTAGAFVGARVNEVPELYVTPLNDFSPKKITNLAAQWGRFKPGTRSLVQWKSKDGATIEGVLITPPNFDKSRKYPLLVVIHGGPTGIDVPTLTADRIYPIDQFVNMGAVVLRPNYRGSAGYGTAFRALNVRNLGVGDAWDVLSGVDHLISQGFVDPARVASMGWSQGGYITAFLSTAHADRFQAFSVGAGISNWVTYYVNTDIHPFTRHYLGATPWQDMAIYQKTSPITYINQAKKPVLIQHGDNDKRVPPPNAFELYQGLKDVGVPARLVLYKGFGHGINKPKEALHVIEDNRLWFTKYLFNQEAGK